jgi:hypothetical protein
MSAGIAAATTRRSGFGDKGGDKLYEHGRIPKCLANHVFALCDHPQPMIPGTHNAGRFLLLNPRSNLFYEVGLVLSGTQALNSEIVRLGMKDILLNYAQLYEALRG